MTRRLALLVNPTSGKGKGGRLLPEIGDRLRRGGSQVEIVVGLDAEDAVGRLREVVAGGVDGVVALGGDGLANLAVQVVAGTDVPLGVVPAGTGNDVARSLGLFPGEPAAATELVVRGHTRSIDLGRAGDRWFAGVLCAGLDSMVNERANRMTWPRGRARYNLAMLAELRTFRPVPFDLEVDGEPWHTEATLVAVGNGPSYGGGMLVCPDARLDDGLFDVTVLGPIPKPEFVRVFPRVYRGTHVTHRAVTVRRAQTIRLSARGVASYADGERVGALPVTAEVVPGALVVFSDRGTPSGSKVPPT